MTETGPVVRHCAACGFTGTYASQALADYNFGRHSCAKRLARLAAASRRAEAAAAAPRRDCAHPGHPHRHGTRTAYVKDRCRCAQCRAANTAASNAAHRERIYGRWHPFEDAARVREHIGMLRAAGIGIDQIAKLAGISRSHVRDLVYPSRGKQAIRRVRPQTARRLLAVQPVSRNRAPRSHVDSTGTRRRLQGLVAIGWSFAQLAARLGRDAGNLKRTVASPTVTAQTAGEVAALFDRLWDQAPPAHTAAQRAVVSATRAYAKTRGWLPPMAWDDIDTDPDPDPKRPDFAVVRNHTELGGEEHIDEIAVERSLNGERDIRLTYAEKVEVMRRMSQRGASIRSIAAHLSTSKRTVSRHRDSAA
jgi:hypothetical protein